MGLFDLLKKKVTPPAPAPAGGAKPRPDFSQVQAGSSSEATPPAGPAAVRTYTVVRGDSLWKIAKRFYGDGNQYRRLHEANRDVIGDNPDKIFPGQTLRIPD